jgi:ceramide glucosyltransferase
MAEAGMLAGIVLAGLALVGIGQALAGWVLVARWSVATLGFPSPSGAFPMGQVGGAEPPPITVLKPLHGDEPLLEAALESTIRQEYGTFQIVFGVQDPADPAIAVVARLRARHPDADIALVIDPTGHGQNRKIGNLINMLPSARHDVIVIADSDLHVRSDYLRRIAACLGGPGIGLATVLYAGLPASGSLPARLGASQITHGFLPGALLARAMGREDCLGATMALRRETLHRIGGLEALVRHLADDNVLGQLVLALGMRVALAPVLVATTVPEDRVAALFRHELRWARTIRALVPASHAASVLQYPLFWAALAAACAPVWGGMLFVLAWAVRAAAVRGIDRALRPLLNGLATPCPVWHLPLRDALSVAVWLVSHAGRRVDWRGQGLHAAPPPRPVFPADSQEPRPR